MAADHAHNQAESWVDRLSDDPDLVAQVPMDRGAIEHGTLEEQGDDRAYWFAATPEERLAALELMRQIAYGYDPATERLQRVLEWAELE